MDQSTPRPDTLYAAFEAAARRYPDLVAFKGDGGEGKSYTYSEILDLVRRLAAGLQSPSTAEVKEVGLLSENRPEWPIAYLAIVAAGKTAVPIDANLRPNEMHSIARHAGLELIFTSARFEPVIDNFEHDLTVYSFDSEEERSWEKAMRAAVDFTPIGDREHIAALIYTSGTTGAPKAVVLTHGNILANLEGIRKAIHFDQNDVFLSLLPLHHTFEATAGFLTPVTNGCCVVYARSLKSRDIVEDIANNGVTVMCGVPLLYEKIYQSMHRKIQAAALPRRVLFNTLFSTSALGWQMGRHWGKTLFKSLRKKAGMERLRIFVSGAAALPPHIARFFTMIGFTFLQGYGLTETSPVISVNRLDDIRFGSVGPPLDGIDVRIEGPDERGIGEIVVRGENCTRGYRNNPEQTTELIRDGWLHTGDLGHMEDGHLWITGRAKNVIISAAGKNIYPEEIEEKLMASDYILESVVFGRQRENRQGEEVRALIVPDIEQCQAEFGVDPEEPDHERVRAVIKEVVAAVNAEIADYKRISGFDLQFQELEKTSTKKIKRFVYH